MRLLAAGHYAALPLRSEELAPDLGEKERKKIKVIEHLQRLNEKIFRLHGFT